MNANLASLELMIKEYAKGMSVLVVDDEFISLEICKNFFQNYFFKVDFARDGEEAYAKWNNERRNYNLIVTDILMPKMNGIELIEKIRLKSNDQKIIVLSALDDLSELREVISYGVDAIMLKPFDKEKTLTVLLRVLKSIYNAKIVKLQLKQLKMIAKDNISLKISQQQSKKLSIESSENKNNQLNEVKKAQTEKNNDMIDKYGIRKSIKGGDAQSFVNTLDVFDIDKVEAFLDKMVSFEASVCKLESLDNAAAKKQLQVIASGLKDFILILNQFGGFSVAQNAAETLYDFIYSLDEHLFDNKEKKELFVTIFLSLLEDIEKWIKTIFIDQTASNINYFDASFANTCLELEVIFSSQSDNHLDEDSLEFF